MLERVPVVHGGAPHSPICYRLSNPTRQLGLGRQQREAMGAQLELIEVKKDNLGKGR